MAINLVKQDGRVSLMFSTEEWHKRFIQQAEWTSSLRQYIFDRISLSSFDRILDVGCGTGALESKFGSGKQVMITGLDPDYSRVSYAHSITKSKYLCGDGFALPFPPASFEITLCNYLLLWVKDPVGILIEMKRVTHPGGYILILSEPDYAHRIDFPEELVELGALQRKALFDQGAYPDIGPSIAFLMETAGIEIIETGLSGGQWRPQNIPEDDMEWRTLTNDLQGSIDPDHLSYLQEMEISSRRQGTRILFIPVFYAIGRIP